jgi:multidrug resistance efflux pump
MHRTLPATSLIVVLTATLLLAAQNATEPSDPPTFTVKRANLNLSFEAPGYFEPTGSADIRVKPRGFAGDFVIAAVAAHGSAVRKGEVLIQFESATFARAFATAQNELRAAEVAMRRAEIEAKFGDESDALAMRVQEEELKNAIAALDWHDRVDSKIQTTQAEVVAQNARDTLGDQNDELDQLRKMYKSEELTNATADIVVKRAVRAVERAKVTVTLQEMRADKIKSQDIPVARQKLEFALEQQKLATEKLKATQAQAREQRLTAVAAAKLAAESAREKCDNLAEDQNLLSVVAPSDGIVLHGSLVGGNWTGNSGRVLRVGEKVAPGSAVMTLFTPASLRFVAEIREDRLSSLKVGQRVRVTPTALPAAKMQGVASSLPLVATARSQGSAFELTIDLTDVDPQVMPGWKGTAYVETESLENVMVVPTTSIADGKVWVVGADGQSRPVDVVLGKSDGRMTEIQSGLNEGDLVLTRAKK